MKSVDKLVDIIKSYDGPPLKLMEVCGTHTHNIFRYGVRDMLPPALTLISGPGCPVCVTPSGFIDRAARLSQEPNSVLCTFGDMVRVPGVEFPSLSAAASDGGRIRVIYSPMEVISLAESEPDNTFIVAAVGFETTIPSYALLIERAIEKNINNIRLLTSLKALIPALDWICSTDPGIGGFIGPGHVSAIIGARAYEPVCGRYGVPLAVAGFGFEHISAAICDLILQNAAGTHNVHNLYPSAVKDEGNTGALELISKYFVKKSSAWRGLGVIEGSGYFLAPEFERFDAGYRPDENVGDEPPGCICGSVIIGRSSPTDCPLFGDACNPLHPVGPCMVSAEGACGIWHANAK